MVGLASETLGTFRQHSLTAQAVDTLSDLRFTCNLAPCATALVGTKKYRNQSAAQAEPSHDETCGNGWKQNSFGVAVLAKRTIKETLACIALLACSLCVLSCIHCACFPAFIGLFRTTPARAVGVGNQSMAATKPKQRPPNGHAHKTNNNQVNNATLFS